jgi:aminoglycoside/choline kinase family phosphotransferase
MTERDDEIAAFLAAAGWSGAERRVLAADASFRRYDRIRLNGRRAVLMDAPPAKEKVEPFIAIARHLVALGYSAPRIYEADVANGFVLIEDLGDDTYTRLLAAGHDERTLYELATDVLVDLHRRTASEAVPRGLAPYDAAALQREADLLVEWYVPAVTGKPAGDKMLRSYRECWRALLPLAHGAPGTLVLRDYHVDNLMLLADRRGFAACGLLDFQDALAGPASYDFISLVEDARRDIAPELIAAMRARYLAGFPALDRDAFEASCAVLAAQRHAKVIGIFTRLCVRDGKPKYLKHIPRVWCLLEKAATHPSLAPIRHWLDANIPRQTRGIPKSLTTA